MAEESICQKVDTVSRDTLFDGELSCSQHINGYRFSVDSVLLAHFVGIGKDEDVIDICAGCGVVGLIILYRHYEKISSLTGFELQSGLSSLASDNICLNSFQKKMTLVQGDVRHILDFFPSESFSTLVCNPPFYTPGTGRQNSEPEILLARHQVACSLSDILSAVSVVKNRGKFVIIYPSPAIGELLSLMKSHRLTVKRIQFVYSYPHPSAVSRLVLVEAVKNGGEGADILPPLYVYTSKKGPYSEDMKKMYMAKREKN